MPNEQTETRCSKPGEWRVMWPGREPLFMCAEHTNIALGIAEAMGFFLYTEVALLPGAHPCSQILPPHRATDVH